jgi:hypothetical protein
MTSSAIKISLKISLVLNLMLLVVGLICGGMFLRYYIETSAALDARPKGEIVALSTAIRATMGNGVSAIELPAGTILQESTPQGAATLGKIGDREYLLILKTDNFQFSTNLPYSTNSTWSEPYQVHGSARP